MAAARRGPSAGFANDPGEVATAFSRGVTPRATPTRLLLVHGGRQDAQAEMPPFAREAALTANLAGGLLYESARRVALSLWALRTRAGSYPPPRDVLARTKYTSIACRATGLAIENAPAKPCGVLARPM